MNSFLKSVRFTNNNKDEEIKKSITKQLSISVKEIQYAGIEDDRSLKNTDISEAANTLCTIIEGMFLHGLKDTLTHRFKKAIADVDERPEPSFWSPLLIVSHRQIIDQITHLSQITTEVGQCRAWIRLALNEGLLSSYLMTIRQDPSTLKCFYKVGAYVRDGELLDVAQRLIDGVETIKSFTLPFNSSLLNSWPLPSLIVAGIWSPTLKMCPVAPCDDVAQTLTDTTVPDLMPESSSETASLCSAISFTSKGSGLRQIVALTEDEVLKIILAKDKENLTNNVIQQVDNLNSSNSAQGRTSDVSNGNYNLGNSLNRRSGWSSDENRVLCDTEEAGNTEENQHIQEPASMGDSFNTLIQSYNMLSETPDIKDVWLNNEDGPPEGYTNTNVETIIEQDNTRIVVLGLPLTETNSTGSNSLTIQLGSIAKEKGLNVQNYECDDCKQPLEISHKPNVCAFTGDYFCDTCMSSELIPIPARIVHNWDFKTYPVSRKGQNYINEMKYRPIIDFKILNPYIYSVVEEMAQLQILRTQLNFLRAYLFTCREPVIKQLQEQIGPREYLYEHIHQYSVSDLLQITNGTLAQQLEKVVFYGKEHVSSCWLCSQKGFVCEVCDKQKPLFPFDVENVFRCDKCYAVYHKTCLNFSKPCPKCERKKKREELPLATAVDLFN